MFAHDSRDLPRVRVLTPAPSLRTDHAPRRPAAQLDYLLPPEFTSRLASCLDDAPRSAWADVRAVVREELGGEPDEVRKRDDEG